VAGKQRWGYHRASSILGFELKKEYFLTIACELRTYHYLTPTLRS
jgi:hypothetical protein